MRVQKFGRIINMRSLNGVDAHMYTAAYNAGKEAMRALTRTAAVEWGQNGITCKVICPAANSPQAPDLPRSQRGNGPAYLVPDTGRAVW
nr:SDR family NAD(P)-dependent oxidoreductase [Novosphingobium sp. P6W]